MSRERVIKIKGYGKKRKSKGENERESEKTAEEKKNIVIAKK